MKKYELTSETKIVFGHILYRIKALSSFGCVSAGDLGGFLESEKNLSQNGNARVSGAAIIFTLTLTLIMVKLLSLRQKRLPFG